MSVRIQLDQRDVPFYTNLDFISGRVILGLNNDITISAINVKLEGESRTRLAGPRSPTDRPDKLRIELELHKFLYKIQTVFPSQDLLQHAPSNPQFTLPAGQHEYPFRFKFPFNNNCQATPTSLQELKLGQLNVPFMQEPVVHLKRALPPSLGGLPGEAEIKYFVKVTVVRPKFYHENMRVVHPLKFFPIESPRPANLSQEQFARRQHQFLPTKRESRIGLFQKSSKSADTGPPNIKVDARLPNPAILTCHKPVPLRVLVEKTNNSQANIYLSMFQIELIAFTQIKAHHLRRTDISSWILLSKANMDLILDNLADNKSKEIQIPSRLWESIPLPNTVIPSFETCNLSRKYELEVRVGLSHSMADQSKPEMVVLPLRLPCQVFSGVVPPRALLHRVTAQGLSVPKPIVTGPVPHSAASSTHVPMPLTPVTPVSDSAPPPSIGTPFVPHPDGHDHDPDDLPPSYEDAIADDIGPVDGPRQYFEINEAAAAAAAQRQQPAYSGDSKSSGGLNRHPSERLFSQNAPRPPGARRDAGLSSDQANTVFEEFSDNDDGARPPPLRVRQSVDESGITNSTGQMRISGTSDNESHNDISDEPPPPPLPTRKPTQPTTNNAVDTKEV